MLELTTLVIMLDTLGGKITLVTISKVGVVGTHEPNTFEDSSIVTE